MPLAIPASALGDLPSPCYVVDQALIERNCEVLARVQEASGARILLALKGFACWPLFDTIAQYLPGCACSGLHEARLAAEHFGGEAHVYSPAFVEEEIAEVAALADHVVDFGPGAGDQGGEVVFSGTPTQLARSKQSLTGQYLSG